MADKSCSVCATTDTTHMHFGSRVCQACAAFFRRTVSLGIRFVCKYQKVCTMGQGGRIFCRACRYDRCESVGMRRELVQEPRATNRIPKYVLRSREEGVVDIVRVYATCTVGPVCTESMETGSQSDEECAVELTEFSSILNVTHGELLDYYMSQVQTSSHHQSLGFNKFSLLEFMKRKSVGDHFAFQICTSCPGTDLLDKDDLSILFRYCSFANIWMDSAWMNSELSEHVKSTGILSSFVNRFSSTVGAALFRLRLEVFEYAALKSFCIWKLAMLDSTLTLKTVSQEQYGGVTSALNKYYQKHTPLTSNEIATRMAELILLIGPIFDAYRDMLSVYEALEIESDTMEKQMTCLKF
ncbi:unnamed protein product [Caenorhabditis sp. 36 PRJEB53466]|nr:unnamed protein product [Caenorhabditis sp. 36 PRJEB53466]